MFNSTVTTAPSPPTINVSLINYGPADLTEDEKFPFDEMILDMGDEESKYDEDDDFNAVVTILNKYF